MLYIEQQIGPGAKITTGQLLTYFTCNNIQTTVMSEIPQIQ